MSNSDNSVETRSDINNVPKDGNWYQIVNDDVPSDVYCALRWDKNINLWWCMTIKHTEDKGIARNQIVTKEYYDEDFNLIIPKPN